MCKKEPKGEVNKIGGAIICFSKGQHFQLFYIKSLSSSGCLADFVYTHQKPVMFSLCF